VANVTPELYQALLPLVTVWPENGLRINIHTAPREVLRALNVDDNLDPLPLAEGDELCRQRSETGFESADAFLQGPQFAGALNAGVSGLIGESSAYFLLLSRVEIADREQQMYSVLRRQQRQIDVVQRRHASLYDVADPGAESCR
jgi:general secretion pathway protein K